MRRKLPTDSKKQDADLSFSAFLDRIQSPALRQVALEWRAARRERVMPAWRDIDLAALGSHSSAVWSCRYDRQSGSFVDGSLRSVPPDQVRAEDVLHALGEHHRRVVDRPALMHGHGCVLRYRGRIAIGERIALPLAEDGRLADGLVAAIACGHSFGVASARALHKPYEDLRCEFFALDPILSVVHARDDAPRADERGG